MNSINSQKSQQWVRNRVMHGLSKRRAADRRFKLFGLMAVLAVVISVIALFADIGRRGIGAFSSMDIQLEVDYDVALIGIEDVDDVDELAYADYRGPLRNAMLKLMPKNLNAQQQEDLYVLLSTNAERVVQERISANPTLLGQSDRLWFKLEPAIKTAYNNNTLAKWQHAWLQNLHDSGVVRISFNKAFLLNGDSRNPSSAGIFNALLGSLFTLLICFALAFPIGVAASIYLEEFATTNRWTDFIEVNINNLAAVPSVIFGLLGLAVFINVFGMPRATPLTGGVVLALLTLPTIIISSRAAIKAVPSSIKAAALGLGASKIQMISSQVLPIAAPGILTGTIIGLAAALGETAPLLMIGMVAFIVSTPSGLLDPATVLPVQIFLWADSPEKSFVELTSGAVMVLLLFLIVMNAAATILRICLQPKR